MLELLHGAFFFFFSSQCCGVHSTHEKNSMYKCLETELPTENAKRNILRSEVFIHSVGTEQESIPIEVVRA